MTLSIIIVNYNVKYFVYQCLTSLLRSETDFDFEIFVVDNDSTDGSQDFLSSTFAQEADKRLHFIFNKRNLGFGRANNQAVSKAKGQYILFINPDTFVGEHTLQICINYARAQKQFGALGVHMLKDNGDFALESRRGIPTPFTAFCKLTGLTSLFPKSRLLGKYYMQYLDIDKANEIEIVSGAFMMTTKAELDIIGAFDKDFFMYGEDIDLSYRLIKAGKKNHFIPSPIIHYKGESTVRSSWKYVHRFYEAMLIFFRKHFSHYHLGLSVLIRIAIYMSGIFALVSGAWQRFKRYMHVEPSETYKHYYILCDKENRTSIQRLCEQWALDVSYLESDAITSKLFDECSEGSCLVCDMSQYTYHDVLQALKASRHKVSIGTFYPQKQLLITQRRVYTL